MEGAARLITVGVHFTDLTSGFFSQHLDDAHRIDLLPHTAVVAGRTFADVEMRDALTALTAILRTGDGVHGGPGIEPLAVPALSHTPLTQEDLWHIVTDALWPGDVVFADQGTAFYGMGAHRMPRDVLFIGLPLWASIGYTLPAVLGAALAAPDRRPVLLIGDGAAQLSIAELGTLIRLRVPGIVLVVNNDGYTVERAIHGPGRRYNDIARWRWADLPWAFGATAESVRSVRVTTAVELSAALAQAEGEPGILTFIEAILDPLDVPPLLTKIAEAAAAANSRSSQ